MEVSLNNFYEATGTVKQNVHGYIERQMKSKNLEFQLLKIVHEIREDHPEMGLRTIYFMIQPHGLGRDAFEDLCSRAGLKVEVKKNYVRTTDSSKTMFSPNFIENMLINRPNQVWQSDITYYELMGRFYYITLIQDAFTKVIVGYNASADLSTESTTLPALQMAIRQRKLIKLSMLIFHSDGGGQFYDKNFKNLSKDHNITSSMGKSCYENAMAERLNGVIKNMYLRHRDIRSLKQLHTELDRTVALYNTKKPHTMLQRMTPVQFEENYLHYNTQTKAKVTESFDAAIQINGACCPIYLPQTKAQDLDVISAAITTMSTT